MITTDPLIQRDCFDRHMWEQDDLSCPEFLGIVMV